MKVPSRIALTLGLALGVSTCAFAQWYAAEIHPSGAMGSFAYGGGPGLVVGNVYPVININPEGCMWIGGSSQNYMPFGSTSTTIRRTDGWDAVGYANIGGDQAIMWFGQGILYANMAPPGSVSSKLFDLSGGRQVGWYRNPGGNNRAAIWSGPSQPIVDLNPGRWYGSAALGISGHTQAGYLTNGTDAFACRWNDTALSYLNMHPAGYTGSQASDVSFDRACGYAYSPDVNSDSNLRAMWWDTLSGTATDLNPSGSQGSRANAISSHYVVGFALDSLGNRNAMLWNLNTGAVVNLHDELSSIGTYESSEATDVWFEGDYVKVCGWCYNGTTIGSAVLWLGKI